MLVYFFVIQAERTDTGLDDSLVAYYPLNENANDESGNGNHGIISGAVLATDRFAHQNSAYVFDGIDDYIELPNSMDIIDTEFTVSAWIKPDDYGVQSPTSQSCHRFIFSYRYRSHAGGDPTNSGLRFGLNKANGCGGNTKISMGFFGPDYQGQGIGADYSGKDWFLYTVTKAQDKLVLYINGEEVMQKVISPSAVFENPQHVYVTIGAHRISAGEVLFPFAGAIDEVRIYNRALSNVEVQMLYQLDW